MQGVKDYLIPHKLKLFKSTYCPIYLKVCETILYNISFVDDSDDTFCQHVLQHFPLRLHTIYAQTYKQVSEILV